MMNLKALESRDKILTTPTKIRPELISLGFVLSRLLVGVLFYII